MWLVKNQYEGYLGEILKFASYHLCILISHKKCDLTMVSKWFTSTSSRINKITGTLITKDLSIRINAFYEIGSNPHILVERVTICAS